jgi:hypothetical protein
MNYDRLAKRSCRSARRRSGRSVEVPRWAQAKCTPRGPRRARACNLAISRFYPLFCWLSNNVDNNQAFFFVGRIHSTRTQCITEIYLRTLSVVSRDFYGVCRCNAGSGHHTDPHRIWHCHLSERLPVGARICARQMHWAGMRAKWSALILDEQLRFLKPR